jgi:micrococcal nuclease
MKYFIFIFILFLISNISISEEITAKVITVYDGDTFTIDKKDIANRNYRIRIRGIDAAEIGWRAKCKVESSIAKQAKDYLVDLLLNKEIKLVNLGADKYNRLLADIYINNENIAKRMLDKKLAIQYSGVGVKPNWCLY